MTPQEIELSQLATLRAAAKDAVVTARSNFIQELRSEAAGEPDRVFELEQARHAYAAASSRLSTIDFLIRSFER